MKSGAVTPDRSPSTVCGGCSLLCDDVHVRDPGGEKQTASGFCDKGIAWLHHPRVRSAQAFHEGRAVKPHAALECAARWLREARAPLIVGLDQLSLQAQARAIAVAQTLRATIDVNWEPLSSFEYAFQKVGRVTATLGEVRDRSSLLIFWGVDPLRTHPRLLERLQSETKSVWFIAHPSRPPQLPSSGSVSLCSDTELGQGIIDQVRDLLRRGKDFAEAASPKRVEQELIRALGGARHLTIFADSQQRSDLAWAMGLHQMVRDLNDRGRAHLIPLQANGQTVQAENQLTAQLGFARGVDLSLGFPRANWDEFTAARRLQRQDCDVVLWFADEDREGLQRRLAAGPQVQWIIANCRETEAPDGAALYVPIRRWGLDELGEACRVDDVQLPVDQLFSPAGLSPEAWLRDLSTRIARS